MLLHQRACLLFGAHPPDFHAREGAALHCVVRGLPLPSSTGSFLPITDVKHMFTILSMGYMCSCMIYLHDECRFTQERSSKGEAFQGNQDKEGISLLMQAACRNRYLPGAYPVRIRCVSGGQRASHCFFTSFSCWRHRWRKHTGPTLDLYGLEAIRRACNLGLCL